MLATQQDVFDYAEIKCAIINGAKKPELLFPILSGGYLDATMAEELFDSGRACGVGTIPNAGGGGQSSESSMEASILNGTLLQVNAEKAQTATLRIFNLLGQTLSTEKLVLQPGTNTINLDMPDYPFVATYICQLQYGKESKTLKFIK